MCDITKEFYEGSIASGSILRLGRVVPQLRKESASTYIRLHVAGMDFPPKPTEPSSLGGRINTHSSSLDIPWT